MPPVRADVHRIRSSADLLDQLRLRNVYSCFSSVGFWGRMGQYLAAVRLRLDNLFIKQSISDRHEPCVFRTKGARCGPAEMGKRDAADESGPRRPAGLGTALSVTE